MEYSYNLEIPANTMELKTCVEGEWNAKRYEDKDNINEIILYIIINKSLQLNHSQEMVVTSHLTSKILYPSDCRFSVMKMEFLRSHGGFGNTVILQAMEEGITSNCLAHYDNIAMERYVEDTERVAHASWKLSKPKLMGVAFLGIKRDIPKWVRKLPLL